MLGTSTKNLIQIVGKDPHKKLLVIITWNFEHNTEESMFQIPYREDLIPENYVVSGMH